MYMNFLLGKDAAMETPFRSLRLIFPNLQNQTDPKSLKVTNGLLKPRKRNKRKISSL